MAGHVKRSREWDQWFKDGNLQLVQRNTVVSYRNSSQHVQALTV